MNKELFCPRCKVLLTPIQKEGVEIDRCGKCQGTFFDQGEMFGALGQTADPSYWDREATAGPATPGGVGCPRCDAETLLQNISDEQGKVEIDRCGHCGGVWLDRGEEVKIMAIGERQAGAVRAEVEAARAELDALGDVDLRPPGLIYRFLSLFKKG